MNARDHHAQPPQPIRDPAAIRDLSFEVIRESLAGRMRAVYLAWVTHGPGTTRQLAERSGIDILNVRPRTTDLIDVGLVELIRPSGDGRQGIYRARSSAEWQDWARQQRKAQSGQLSLI